MICYHAGDMVMDPRVYHRVGGQSAAGKGGRPGVVLQPEAEGEEDEPQQQPQPLLLAHAQHDQHVLHFQLADAHAAQLHPVQLHPAVLLPTEAGSVSADARDLAATAAAIRAERAPVPGVRGRSVGQDRKLLI